jgi:hypothetical protein
VPVVQLIVVAALACVVSLAAGYLWGFQGGTAAVLVDWDKERLAGFAAVERERQRVIEIERRMELKVREQADVYSKEILRRETAAAGTRRELDRLRVALARADRGPSAAPADDRPEVDGGAALATVLLGECATQLVEMGGHAERLAGQVIGLQQYVRTVEAN